MKKLLGVLGFLFVIVLGFSYLFLPSSITVTTNITMQAPANRIYTLMANPNEWNKWWPVQTSGHSAELEYNGNVYSVSGEVINTIETIIHQKDSVLTGSIFVASLNIDSSILEWSIRVNTGANPFKRIRNYFTSDNIKGDMTNILLGIKKFAEKQENLYGMNIEKAMVTDTLLIATKEHFSHYPSTQDIYRLIEKLQTYIKSENARETNPPMLNVNQADTNSYNVMVAIPTNRLLSGKGDIVIKRMVPGKIIWGEVKGGPFTVETALQQLENFKNDYRLSSPAIPFASLISDRTKEPDSSKWVTRVYYPIL